MQGRLCPGGGRTPARPRLLGGRPRGCGEPVRPRGKHAAISIGGGRSSAWANLPAWRGGGAGQPSDLGVRSPSGVPGVRHGRGPRRLTLRGLLPHTRARSSGPAGGAGGARVKLHLVPATDAGLTGARGPGPCCGARLSRSAPQARYSPQWGVGVKSEPVEVAQGSLARALRRVSASGVGRVGLTGRDHRAAVRAAVQSTRSPRAPQFPELGRKLPGSQCAQDTRRSASRPRKGRRPASSACGSPGQAAASGPRAPSPVPWRGLSSAEKGGRTGGGHVRREAGGECAAPARAWAPPRG